MFTDGLSVIGVARTEDESTDPGAVIGHGGMWHMFYRSERVWREDVTVWHATSPDGLVWERQGELFTKDQLGLGFGDRTVAISTATVLDDGTWALFFHTIVNTGDQGIPLPRVIGRLTAPGPGGPWTLDSSPVLEPGDGDAWDAAGVGNPSVVVVGDEYWMYYDGHRGDSDAAGDRGIGLAVSTDGLSWSKREDPVLLPPDEGWDAGRVYDPNVVVTDEGFVMSYTSTVADSFGTLAYARGLAFSDDGISWEVDPANPFFRTDQRGFTWSGLASMIHTGDAYVVLANLETGVTADIFDVRIWAMVHRGDIRPGD